MYHYFYITINRANNKYYYGIHSTKNLNDGYLGSGNALKRAIRKYGKSLFIKYIISYHNTRYEALEHEAMVVNSDVTEDPLSYNICKGGRSGPEEHTEASKKRMGWSKGIPHSAEWKENIGKALRGRDISKSHRNNISKSWKTRPAVTEETRKLMSIARTGKIGPRGNASKLFGRHHSENTKKKMSRSCNFNISNTFNGINYVNLRDAFNAFDNREDISFNTFCLRMKSANYMANSEIMKRKHKKALTNTNRNAILSETT
jgi:hypothetical protein